MKYRVFIEPTEGTKMWYQGYLPNGGSIVLTENRGQAYEFPAKQFAQNIIGGDERLSQGKIEESDA